MQHLSLTTSSLFIEENTVLFDDGTLENSVIQVSPGSNLSYTLVSSVSHPISRVFSLGSGSIFTGSGIYIWSDMESKMSVSIGGIDTKATLSLLALAKENAKIKVDGIWIVALGSKNISLRVDQTNILLGKNTVVHGKPVLEVATDSIEWGHSCKVHQISWEALYYLEIHGIDRKTAEGMLLDAQIRHHLAPLGDETQNIQEEIQKKLGFL